MKSIHILCVILLSLPLYMFAEMEAFQFNNCNRWSSESHQARLNGRVVTEEDKVNPDFKDRIWGLFGEKGTLAHFDPTFLEHYNRSFHFPGGHTPTADEVRCWYVPLAKKLLRTNFESK